MDLPEIKRQIIQLLDDKSRRQLRVVNTDWFNLIRYDKFQIYYATPTLFPTIIERFSQYNWPLGLELLHTINITSEHVEHQIFKLTQLTSFGCHVVPRGTKEINPNWTKLTVLTNLQYFNLMQDPISVDLVYYYTNLTRLEISSGNDLNCPKDMIEVLFTRCTKLEHLQLSMVIPPDTKAPRLDQLHRLTYLFVNSSEEMLNLTTMTNLRYLSTIFVRGVNIGNITTLETLDVEGEIVGDISRNKNLTQLMFDVQHNARHVTVLSSLKSLQMLTLTLKSNFHNNVEVNNNEVLLMTSQYLTGLVVNVDGDFNIKNISHLTNLRSLELSAPDEVQYEVTAEDFKPFKHLTNLSAGEQYAAIKYLPELRDFSAWDYFTLSDGSTMDDFDPTCIPKLEYLSFSKSLPSSVFSRLKALRSLKRLTVFELPNETYDYDVLTYMDLEHLQMSPKKLKRDDWLALQKLTKLKTLLITTSEVTDDMTLLTSLTRLTNLSVDNAKLEHYLPFTFLKHMSCYPRLTISRQLLNENFPYLHQHSFNVTERG